MIELHSIAAAIPVRINDRVKDPWQTIEMAKMVVHGGSGQSEIRIGLKINNFRLINEVLRDCHNQLLDGGFLFGFFESLTIRKKHLRTGRGKFRAIVAVYWDFILRRFLPKVWPFKELNKKYHLIRNRALSKCEMFGRLYFCGFEVLETSEDDDYSYFKAKKVRPPSYETQNYGILIHLPRIGKQGRLFNILKLRTMHPYAQFLHEHLLKFQGFAESGKVNDDFRMADWGRVLRKLWLDELPQVINLIKGDMRLFGVRALSVVMYDHYPEDLQKERILMKPGLIPPYYCDLPKSIEEVFASERRYLELRKRYGVLIDVKYLIKAVYNIVIKGARSE